MLSFENAGRIFPGDSRACFHLCPADLGFFVADAALGHEIEDTSFPFCISGIPVLYSAVLDLRTFQSNEFHHGGVQLILVPHGGSASFEITHIGSLVCNEQGAFELTGSRFVDAEIGAQFHRAAHALGNVAEGAVREYG